MAEVNVQPIWVHAATPALPQEAKALPKATRKSTRSRKAKPAPNIPARKAKSRSGRSKPPNDSHPPAPDAPPPTPPAIQDQPGELRCLVLRPGSKSPEAEGAACLNYTSNTVLIGASSLPAPQSLGCHHYAAWLRKPSAGIWRRIDLTNNGEMWTGHALVQLLHSYDRLAVTAERDSEPNSPNLPSCVLVSDLANALPFVSSENHRPLHAGRYCIALSRTLGAPNIDGVAYLNLITNVLLLATYGLPKPDAVHPGSTVWITWLRCGSSDLYQKLPMHAVQNGFSCIRTEVNQPLTHISEIIVSAEDIDAVAPYGRRVLIADIHESCGPF